MKFILPLIFACIIKVVETRMDLGTVIKKLSRLPCKAAVVDLIKLVRTVWHNCQVKAHSKRNNQHALKTSVCYNPG